MKASVFLILAVVITCQFCATNCQHGEGEENIGSVGQHRWGERWHGHGGWHHRHPYGGGPHWGRRPWHDHGPPGHHGHHGYHGHQGWHGHVRSHGCHHPRPGSDPGSTTPETPGRPPFPVFPGRPNYPGVRPDGGPPVFVPPTPPSRPGGYPDQHPDGGPPVIVTPTPPSRPGGYPDQRPDSGPPVFVPPPTTAPQRPEPDFSKEDIEPGEDYGLDVRFLDADQPQTQQTPIIISNVV